MNMMTDMAAPHLQPETSLSAPAREGLGVVLAVNCTPPDADPQVLAFWRALARELAAIGHRLVLASTVALEPDPTLTVVDMPFLMPDFARRPAGALPLAAPGAAPEADDVAHWYGCTAEEAVAGLAAAERFFTDLLATVKPAAITGWQSANPVTAVLRRCALAAGVPFWAGERGWVRNTLMFDLADNSALGEGQLSLGLAAARERYVPSAWLLAELTARARSAADLARYPGQLRVDGATLRTQLGIPPQAPVVALFTHGEPSFSAVSASAVGALHDLSPALLQQRVDAVAAELLARGCWLLVQEHPFNRDNGRMLTLPSSPRILSVAENVSSVLDAADVCLFTVATLQFDAVFLGKPFGLLSRSPLYRSGTPPMFGDYPTPAAFVDALTALHAWPAARDRLARDIAFLFEHSLLDVTPSHVEQSASRWARHLGGLVRPAPTGLDAGIRDFMARWSPADATVSPVPPTPTALAQSQTQAAGSLPAPRQAALARPTIWLRPQGDGPQAHVDTALDEADIDDDPIAGLERALGATPSTQSVAPEALGRFHRSCRHHGLAQALTIDESQLRQDASGQPAVPSLLVVELMLATGRLALGVELAETLYVRWPMDLRVQDVLTRARLYLKQGRVAERPGLELQGSYCPVLWNSVHVQPGGNVHMCCSVWLRTPVGNVFETPLQDIWRSPEARAMRDLAAEGDYRFCGKIACPAIQRRLFDPATSHSGEWKDEVPAELPAPKRFNLSYDLTCNLSCPSCRSGPIAAKGEELDRIETVTTHVLELLKQGERVEVTGSGDPFSSKSFRRLLTSLNPVDFPKLRITIMTNAQLLRRREWTRFQHLHGMIDAINVSVDAATAESYRQIRRGGELEDLLPNLAFIGELRAQGAIRHYRLCFVVQQQNYREMPAFVAMAEQYNADNVHFQMLHDWGSIPAAQLRQMRVHVQDHPEHAQFLGVLRSLPAPARPRIISDFSALV